MSTLAALRGHLAPWSGNPGAWRGRRGRGRSRMGTGAAGGRDAEREREMYFGAETRAGAINWHTAQLYKAS